MMKAVAIFVIGILAGALLGRATSVRVPKNPQLEIVRDKLTTLSETELEEYHQLKTMRERYEKADELLGKMLMILIADLGLRVSGDKEAKARDSAEGRRPNLEVERESKAVVSATPPPAQNPAAIAENTPLPMGNAESPGDKPPTPTGVPGGGFVSGTPTFQQLEFRGQKPCEKLEPGWFVTSERLEDYKYGVDLTSPNEPVAYIHSSSENPRGIAELSQCFDPTPVVGTRMRLTAMVKTENSPRGARLHLRAFDGTRKFRDRDTTFRDGSPEWRELRLDMEIPQGANRILYGIGFMGTGKVWIKNVNFKPIP